MFPQSFVTGLILASLVMTGAAVTALLLLLLKDYLQGRIW